MSEAAAKQKLRLAERMSQAADGAEAAISNHARKQRAAGRRAEEAQAAAQAEADKARKVIATGALQMHWPDVEDSPWGVLSS